MEKYIFSGLVIIAGAILIAAAEIVNGTFGMLLGIPLICWGILERIIPIIMKLLKNKKQ